MGEVTEYGEQHFLALDSMHASLVYLIPDLDSFHLPKVRHTHMQ